MQQANDRADKSAARALASANKAAARTLAKAKARDTAIKEDPAPAAPATQPVNKDKGAKPDIYAAVNRRIVEFCAGEKSRLGAPHFHSKKSKCEHIRLTVKEDVTTPEGRNLAIRAVQANNTLLWASMPCTGGSPWQEINKLKPGG